MSNKAQETNKVALLSAGIVAAVGFAGWSIWSAIAPHEAPQSEVKTAPPPQPVAPAATGPAATGPATQHPPRTANQPAAGNAPADTLLAPAADPFAALPKGAARPVGQTGEGKGPAASPSDAGAQIKIPLTTPSPVGPPGGLPPVGPGAVGSTGGPGQAASRQPESAPQLVGTLTGTRPAAVFRTDRGIVVVSEGGMVKSWRVLSVQHGSAVVKSPEGKKTLSVTTMRGSGAIREPEPAPPSRVDSAPAVRPEEMASLLPAAAAVAEEPRMAESGVTAPVSLPPPTREGSPVDDLRSVPPAADPSAPVPPSAPPPVSEPETR